MNKKNYNFKLLEESKNKGKINYKTIRVTSNNKKQINVKELDEIYKYLLTNKKLENKKISMIGKHKAKVAMKGMTDIFRTIKNFDDPEIKTADDYDEEYIRNKSLTRRKLNNFYFVDIIIEL
jgi:hypothetical protein